MSISDQIGSSVTRSSHYLGEVIGERDRAP
jgi:hypothetical protein